jgi:hypothetical protein
VFGLICRRLVRTVKCAADLLYPPFGKHARSSNAKESPHGIRADASDRFGGMQTPFLGNQWKQPPCRHNGKLRENCQEGGHSYRVAALLLHAFRWKPGRAVQIEHVASFIDSNDDGLDRLRDRIVAPVLDNLSHRFMIARSEVLV